MRGERRRWGGKEEKERWEKTRGRRVATRGCKGNGLSNRGEEGGGRKMEGRVRGKYERKGTGVG